MNVEFICGTAGVHFLAAWTTFPMTVYLQVPSGMLRWNDNPDVVPNLATIFPELWICLLRGPPSPNSVFVKIR